MAQLPVLAPSGEAPPSPQHRYLLQTKTGDAKTGPIAATYAPRETCPPSCGFYDKGCYALAGFRTAHTWARVSTPGAPGLEGRAEHPSVASQDAGDDWQTVMDWIPLAVRKSPHGILRWGIAGDLPGVGETIDVGRTVDMLGAVAKANGQPIVYTHRSDHETLAVSAMAKATLGQAVNLSCDDVGQLDAVMAAGLPGVVVMPLAKADGDGKPWKRAKTPEGNPVLQCPAEYTNTTCGGGKVGGKDTRACGNGRPLCARPERPYGIGFSAHGTQRKAAVERSSAVLPVIG